MNFFHRHSFLSDVLFSRCSSFLHTYLDKFDFLRNLFRRLVISIVRLFFSKVGYNLLVPVYTNCPSGWLLVFTRRQDNLYDFSRKTSNCANTFASCPCEVWEKGGSDLKKQTPSYCAGLWSPLEVKFLSSAGASTEYSNKNKRPVIIYRLGEGGERRILGGMT